MRMLDTSRFEDAARLPELFDAEIFDEVTAP